jgi:hypothetical protein
MFEASDSPPDNSATLLRRKGVISAPDIFYSSASVKAVAMASLILDASASLSSGIGTANIIPV